jgi:hypothetical protein
MMADRLMFANYLIVNEIYDKQPFFAELSQRLAESTVWYLRQEQALERVVLV